MISLPDVKRLIVNKELKNETKNYSSSYAANHYTYAR